MVWSSVDCASFPFVSITFERTTGWRQALLLTCNRKASASARLTSSLNKININIQNNNEESMYWHIHCTFEANSVSILMNCTQQAYRYCREIITSPFWFKTITIEIMVANLYPVLLQYERKVCWFKRVVGTNNLVSFHSWSAFDVRLSKNANEGVLLCVGIPLTKGRLARFIQDGSGDTEYIRGRWGNGLFLWDIWGGQTRASFWSGISRLGGLQECSWHIINIVDIYPHI